MERVKSILAYQQTPLILTCQQSGELPEDFLTSLTDDEREYVSTRNTSPVEPVFYELLSRIGAAGVLSEAPPVLLDLHAEKPRVFTSVDGIGIPLAEEPSTHEWLVKEYVNPYRTEIDRVVAKTKQRFGDAHIVFLSVLPRFIDGNPVDHDLVVFGDRILDDGVYMPEELKDSYAQLMIASHPRNTWIGIHPKLFSTHTLRQELVERLSRMKIGVIAEP